jgi:pimeloyl-ACP methyl ester carboxylesterase
MCDVTLTGQAPTSTETELVRVNNIDLFVRSIGTGPDVVVLHGGPSATHLSLLPAFDRLATGRRLRYYDQRGCGQSRVTPDVPLDWQHYVDDLRELLDSGVSI